MNHSRRVLSPEPWLAAGLCLLVACNSTPPVTETRAAAGDNPSAARSSCEADYDRYAGSRDLTRLSQKSKSLAGTTASYAATGSVAVTETLVYAGGGIVVGALICSPIIAIEAAADGNGEASIECVARVGSYAMVAIAEESDYSLTQGVWRATESMRLESYDSLAAYLLDSVECRIERNGPGDREQARQQLKAFRGDHGIWSYLSSFSKERAERLERLADQTAD